MNELKMIFDKLNIDFDKVLKAALLSGILLILNLV